MKVRTCVIFACMTIVPALAMFSHMLPAQVRESLRTGVWEQAENWISTFTNRESATVRDMSGCGSADAPSHDQTAAVPDTVPVSASPAAVATPSPSTEALVALGAKAIDCRPFDGLAGTHVASCRVAVDSAGQLHRVFQAAGASPDDAFAALLDSIRAWRERVASRTTESRL